MIAAAFLIRLDFVAFGAVFFLSQLALVVPLLEWTRRRAGAAGTAASGSPARAGY